MPKLKSIGVSLVCAALLASVLLTTSASGQSQNQIPVDQPAATTAADVTVPCLLPLPQPGTPHPGVQPSGVAIPCPLLDIARFLPGVAQEDPDVAFDNAFIDQQFLISQQQLAAAKDIAHETESLGRAMIYDKHLSVNNNAACATCHVPYAGYKGGSSLFNGTTSAQPGSVPITNSHATLATGPNWRISSRVPQTYPYAPFSPVLHYNATQGDFYGGNFWDMRAGGIRLENPAAEQAQGPPGNPVELGDLLEPAIAVYKLSLEPYAVQGFMTVWGDDLTAIHFPSNIAQLAATPGPPPANNPFPVVLSPTDRHLVSVIYDHMGQSMSAFEAGPEASPFSSKFDFALANPTTKVLSPEEERGWALFRGKAKCNTCHLDGTENLRAPIRPANAADVAPLFTDFTSANIGTPQNFALPYLYESHPDQFGFTANPLGLSYVDFGVGTFLRNQGAAPVPNLDWIPLAPKFDGKVQTPTLRNVDMRPRPNFVKAYMHNGYLKSLKAVVHFYNTRDSLNNGVHLPAGQPGEGIRYWPPPEVSQNVDTTIGNLGLSNEEEDAIVAFLQTLTDGFTNPPQP